MHVATLLTTEDEERRRRALLAASDSLLDRVEELRLADRTETPTALQEAIGALERRLGTCARAGRTQTLHAAHDLVFAVQERLLALAHGRPFPRRHPDRAAGAPAMAAIGRAERWKLLVLPARPEASHLQGEWRAKVLATLERGLDRWSYAQHHAGRAARSGQDAQPALRRARVAWANYWELHREAEGLGVIGRPAGCASPRP